MRTEMVCWFVGLLVRAAHQQVLNQSLDVLGGLGGRRVVRRQLDECGQEILTLLDILLHFLYKIRRQLFNFCA